MIITNIIGGLGNQMFQYAAARHLSLKLASDLKVDISDFSGYKLHQGFELDRLFNIDAKLALDEDINNIIGVQKYNLMRRILRKSHFKFLRHKNYIVEPHFNYWDGVNYLNDNSYLDGYWQSERYFGDNADKIRAEFTFKIPFSKTNNEIAAHILQLNAISLHVRRGDYVTNPKNAYIGFCSLDYYKAAINQMMNKIKDPVFFVFSDDIEWVKNNLLFASQAVFVDHNKNTESYNDMRLMSLCKHHIIANSSFSWWGAWLNANPKKLVIAPKNWFRNGTDDGDLIPAEWIRL